MINVAHSLISPFENPSICPVCWALNAFHSSPIQFQYVPLERLLFQGAAAAAMAKKLPLIFM